MLDGVAMVITSAREANMAVHTSPDRRGSNSEMKRKTGNEKCLQ